MYYCLIFDFKQITSKILYRFFKLSIQIIFYGKKILGLEHKLENENLEVLHNISNCINDKLAILNIKLSELARDADVDYFSLRKIVNQEETYMPNLRILVKLAKYLNIQVGDLLKYNILPQYVPIIDKKDVYNYLKADTKLYGFKNKVFSEKFIHEKSFAIKEISDELLLPTEIIYICYPNSYKKMIANQVYLFETLNEQESELVFGRVHKISSNGIDIVTQNKHQIITKYNIVAIVVSMQISETFI